MSSHRSLLLRLLGLDPIVAKSFNSISLLRCATGSGSEQIASILRGESKYQNAMIHSKVRMHLWGAMEPSAGLQSWSQLRLKQAVS